MLKKYIEIINKNRPNIAFVDYYSLHVNKENTYCKICIPTKAKLVKKSGETVDVKTELYISVGDTVKVCLSGDIDMNIDCHLVEINNINENQLELVCKIFS